MACGHGSESRVMGQEPPPVVTVRLADSYKSALALARNVLHRSAPQFLVRRDQGNARHVVGGHGTEIRVLRQTSPPVVTVRQADSHKLGHQVAFTGCGSIEQALELVSCAARPVLEAKPACRCPPGGQVNVLWTYSAVPSAAADFTTSTAVAHAAAVPLQAQGAS